VTYPTINLTINLTPGEVTRQPILPPADNSELVRLRTDLADAVAERDAAQRTLYAVEAWLEDADSKRYAELIAGEITLDQALVGYHLAIRHDIERLEAELCTRRQMAKDLEFDNTRLAQECATLRSYALAPKTAPPAADLPQQQPPAIAAAVQAAALSAQSADQPAPDDWIMRLQMTFADDPDMQDWLSGIAAGRNTFRALPKPTRTRIIAAVVRGLYDPEDGSPPQMHQYAHHRPAWLPSAQSIVVTFGNGKWESIIELAAQP
jgi:hypothetical protein